MNKTLRIFFVLSLYCTCTFAQKPLYNRQQIKRLDDLSTDILKKEKDSYAKALGLAKQNGWTIRTTHKDGTTMALQGLDGLGNPIYYKTHSNFDAGKTTRTNSLYEGGSLGLKLNGGSTFMVGKLAIWDGGAVLRTHQEFGSRVTQLDNASTTDAHATHTTGTMIASGINPIARGMSFGANISAYDFSNDLSEMTKASPDLLISNHSYGAYAGWSFNTTRNRWEWYGTDKMSTTEDFKYGFYEESASAWDKLAYNAPYYLMVQSAGNDRNNAGPAPGTWYFLGSSTRDSSKAERNQSIDYDLIDTHALAKNCLTVGAVITFPNAPKSPSDVRMSSFSSWGPTDDGRIKPDLVGVGVSVVSTTNTNNTGYGSLSGTSMSSPQVAGSLFLLQELYASLNDKQFMRSATLKALALHTTDEAGRNPGPDYEFGWGILNAEKAATVLLNKDKSHLVLEKQLAQGEGFTQNFIANGRGPLSFTIVWTDPESPATLLVKENLNSRVPKLINDLDIKVSDGSGNFLPWVLDPEQPAKAATKGDNFRDNVEQISILDAVPGKTYTLTVSHKGTLVRAPQAYSLVISGVSGAVYCASTATDKADSKINNVTFGSINSTAKADCASYTDLTNLVANVSVGQQVPLELTLGSCGASTDKIAKVFIDWNGDADFDDANELVTTTPSISGTGTFKTTVNIPAGIVVGNSTRMRVVCTETTDASKVNSCGNYSKGETQEFLIKFIRPALDLALVGLGAPDNNFCSGIPINNVSVVFRNAGINAIQGFAVKVQVKDESNTTVGSFEGVYTKSLGSLSEDKLIVKGSFEPKVGHNYTFALSLELSNDQDPSNNTLTVKRNAAAANVPPTAKAFACEEELNLTAEGNGTVYWYDAPQGGNLISIGNKVIKPKPTQSSFYAALNDFSGTVGAPNKAVFPTGGYNQFSPSVRITTQVPLILEAARLYIGNAGKIIFSVQRESDGVEVSSVVLDVKATRSPALAGVQDNDPNDQGQVYPLGLTIPLAGTYQIAVAFEDGATIFRNRDNIKGYPFTIPGVMSIIGNTASAPSDPLQFYYYFYDLKVKAAGCVAPNRTEVKVGAGQQSAANIAGANSIAACAGASVTLSANAGTSFAWRKDGKEIANANKNTFEVKEAGQYAVTVKETDKCPVVSPSVGVSFKPLPPRPDITRADNVLTTTSTNTLQWFFNSSPIIGASSKTHVGLQTGRYYVQSTVEGCSSISDEITIIVTAQETPLQALALLEVYPNPVVNEIVTIKYRNNEPSNKAQLSIYDLSGILLKTQAMEYKEGAWTVSTSLSGAPSGQLILKVSDQKSDYFRKVTKQ
jgi:hypothetical protein